MGNITPFTPRPLNTPLIASRTDYRLPKKAQTARGCSCICVTTHFSLFWPPSTLPGWFLIRVVYLDLVFRIKTVVPTNLRQKKIRRETNTVDHFFRPPFLCTYVYECQYFRPIWQFTRYKRLPCMMYVHCSCRNVCKYDNLNQVTWSDLILSMIWSRPSSVCSLSSSNLFNTSI